MEIIQSLGQSVNHLFSIIEFLNPGTVSITHQVTHNLEKKDIRLYKKKKKNAMNSSYALREGWSKGPPQMGGWLIPSGRSAAESRRLGSATWETTPSPGCRFCLLNLNLWTRCFVRLNPKWDRDHKRLHHSLCLDCTDVQTHSSVLRTIPVSVCFNVQHKWNAIRISWPGLRGTGVPTHYWELCVVLLEAPVAPGSPPCDIQHCCLHL